MSYEDISPLGYSFHNFTKCLLLFFPFFLVILVENLFGRYMWSGLSNTIHHPPPISHRLDQLLRHVGLPLIVSEISGFCCC